MAKIFRYSTLDTLDHPAAHATAIKHRTSGVLWGEGEPGGHEPCGKTHSGRSHGEGIPKRSSAPPRDRPAKGGAKTQITPDRHGPGAHGAVESGLGAAKQEDRVWTMGKVLKRTVDVLAKLRIVSAPNAAPPAPGATPFTNISLRPAAGNAGTACGAAADEKGGENAMAGGMAALGLCWLAIMALCFFSDRKTTRSGSRPEENTARFPSAEAGPPS